MASLIRRKYKAKDKDGKIVQRQSPYWYIDYKTADGTRKRLKGFKDKAATAQLAAKLEREAELAQAGVVDRYAEHRKAPLSKHLADFKQSLLDKGDKEKHACLVHNRAKAIVDSCGFVCFSDISASKVQRYLAERRRGGLSIRSSNFYLQAIKQFLGWLVADNRAAENPLAYLKGQNPQTDIRHERRALTLEELGALLTATLQGEKHHSLTGKERYMLYTLAAVTGFRASELASLTWRSFNLDDSEPSITVLAGYAKNDKKATLPLRKDMAGQLRRWLAEGSFARGDKVFPKFNELKGAEMLRKDLEVAGIPYQDETGRYADFHSLRHCFASILGQSGVSPKVAQSLLRHSTIGLTMDTYTHIGLYDERAAIDSLPELPGLDTCDNAGRNAEALKTGTDDLPVVKDKSAYKPVYKELAKNTFPEREQLSSLDQSGSATNSKKEGLRSDGKRLLAKALDTKINQMSPPDNATEQEGFEPPLPFGRTVFKTVALSRSATAPSKNGRALFFESILLSMLPQPARAGLVHSTTD
jgi:integrase